MKHIFLILGLIVQVGSYSNNKLLEKQNWVVEQQKGGKVIFQNFKIEIIDKAGCTVWYNKKLKSPVEIVYQVRVVDKGGKYDRVSDLNCFWMSQDLKNEDFFKMSEHRAGKFKNYHSLRQYYVGLGGHNNSKTRFRRYVGNGKRPLLPEHDLSDNKFLIKANSKHQIKITVNRYDIRYYFDGELLFQVYDDNPYLSGFFGFRTVDNHMIIEDFRIN
jgi:hypothetical protein